MSENRMTFFLSFVKAIDTGCRTDAEKGKLYSAITHYAFFGEVPQTMSDNLSALFELIKPIIDGAKDRKKKRTKSEQCSNNVQTMSEQNANNVCDFSLNDIHTPIPNPNSNSLCHTFSYPETVDAVLAEAERAGAVISREEAERYFVCRMSSNWVDAAGRKVELSRIGFDIKRWVLNSEKSGKAAKAAEKGKAQREVDYVPKF